MPAGLSFNATSMTVSGTPSFTGTQSFTVAASDLGGTVQQTFSVTSTAPAPTWTAGGALAAALLNAPYSEILPAANAADGETPVYAVVGSMPAGLSFNEATRTVSGAATFTGTASFIISATDAGGTVQQTFTITEHPASCSTSIPAKTVQPVSSLVSSNPVMLGNAYLLYISIGGAGGPQLSVDGGATWAVGGDLPAGSPLYLRLTSSASQGTSEVATLSDNCSWTVTTAITTPMAYTITSKTGQTAGSSVTSASISPVGYNAPTTISVSGQGNPKLQINGGALVTSATMFPGQSFTVTLTASSTSGGSNVATVNVGGMTGTFTVTTQ